MIRNFFNLGLVALGGAAVYFSLYAEREAEPVFVWDKDPHRIAAFTAEPSFGWDDVERLAATMPPPPGGQSVVAVFYRLPPYFDQSAPPTAQAALSRVLDANNPPLWLAFRDGVTLQVANCSAMVGETRLCPTPTPSTYLRNIFRNIMAGGA